MRADRLVATLLLMQARGRARRHPPPRRSSRRTFRVDRIIDAVVTDLAAERPAGFELSAAWERVVDEVEQRRSLLAAPTALMIAQHLAGWDAFVEVVEPEAVQAELARIGSELTERYANRQTG